jgi:cytochrome c-type biogenesis protein CcmF
MPWLLAAALLHSAIVVEKREALKSWTILLAILAFGFSLIGTFIVRSGVLTSVHAFANDPERGVFILMILGFFTGGALMLYAWRASAMEAKGVFGVVSRESALVINNILLAVSCFVVFIGTIWPLVAELFFDRKLSVGPPFFNLAFSPFMLGLAVVLPIGALIPWKRGKLVQTVRLLTPALALALALGLLVYALQTGRSALGPIGVALGVWLVAGTLVELWVRSAGRPARVLRLPRADLGKAVAHSGLGITIFAVAALLAWESEDIRVSQIGDSYVVGGYEITLTDVRQEQGPNYITTKAVIDLHQNDDFIATVFPEKRFYPIAQMPTTEAGIDLGWTRDLYVVIGDPQEGGGWAVRTYIKPYANWIWLGSIIMALGGVLSLSDRRYRVAAGARKSGAATPVPAE